MRNPVEGARGPRKPAESTAQGLSRHEVTDWLDAGVGLRDVQDFARHTDPKTARGYDRSRNQLGPPRDLRHRPVPRWRQLTPPSSAAATRMT